MKTLFKYLLNAGDNIFMPRLMAGFMQASKRLTIILCLSLFSQTLFGQLNSRNLIPDSMTFFAMGTSNIFINRQGFDRWTKANYNITEGRNIDTYIDFGIIANFIDLGLNFNIGSAFTTNLVYIGARLTRKRSPISSWLNFEWGEYLGVFTNIAPLNYTPTPDQVGQDLELHYDSNFIGLTSKNYLNFLHFNARLGRQKIPFNTGFFVGVAFQPNVHDWRYGYYNTDTVFVSNKIHNIPRLSKMQGSAGIFLGF